MSDLSQSTLQNQGFVPSLESVCWFAIQTYPRHEKRVASQLMLKGVEHYLPVVSRLTQWSDRRKVVEFPLFPCYLFVHIAPSAERRVNVLQLPGVIAFVGPNQHATPIPDNQIEDVRTLLKSKVALDPYPFLKIGQRVRIRSGSLDGIEGILVRRNGTRRLIISVDSLERSLSICVEGLEIEAI